MHLERIYGFLKVVWLSVILGKNDFCIRVLAVLFMLLSTRVGGYLRDPSVLTIAILSYTSWGGSRNLQLWVRVNDRQ